MGVHAVIVREIVAASLHRPPEKLAACCAEKVNLARTNLARTLAHVKDTTHTRRDWDHVR